MSKGIWQGMWQPGDYASVTAKKIGKGKISIHLEGPLPRKGTAVQLLQLGPRSFKLEFRSGGCIVKDVAESFDLTWEFKGKFGKVSSIEIETKSGTKTVTLS